MRSVLIECYPPDFTDYIRPTGPGIDRPVRIVLWPITHKFVYVLCRSKFGNHVSQSVSRFSQPWVHLFRLNLYDGISVAIDCFLSQPVQIAIQMDPCTCGDVRSCDFIRVSQTRHVFSAACVHEIQTKSLLANVRFVTSMPGVVRNLYRSLGSEITLVSVLSFFSVYFPHIEFRQSLARPRFAALDLMNSLSDLISSLFKNDST